MKKFVLSLLCLLFLFSISTQKSHALIKPFSLYFGAGVLADKNCSFKPLNWTAGANMDLSLGPIMLSPEFYILVKEFDFSPFRLAPGVIANMKFANLFVGAGLTKWFLVGSGGSYSTDLKLKVNAGLKGMGVKLTAFAITDFDNFFKSDYFWLGATLSFGF